MRKIIAFLTAVSIAIAGLTPEIPMRANEDTAPETADADWNQAQDSAIQIQETDLLQEEGQGILDISVTTEGGSITIAGADTSRTLTVDDFDGGTASAFAFPDGTEVSLTAEAWEGFAVACVEVSEAEGDILAQYGTGSESVINFTAVSSADHRILVEAAFVSIETDEAMQVPAGEERPEVSTDKANETQAETLSDEGAGTLSEALAGESVRGQTEYAAQEDSDIRNESGAEENGAEENETASDIEVNDDIETGDAADRLTELPAEWVIGDYPADKSIVYYSARYIWAEDATFDPALDYAHYGTDENVTQTYESGTIDFVVGETYPVTYKFALADEADYSWTGVVPFTVVANRSEATVKSELCDRWIRGEVIQGEEWDGEIPELSYATVTGPDLTVYQGDDDFDLYLINLGYDPELFNMTVTDEGDFDVDVPGVYQVIFEVSHYMLPHYPWYVSCQVTVLAVEDTDGATGMQLMTRNLTAEVTDEEGVVGSASYGQVWVSQREIVSAVFSTWLESDMELSFMLLQNGEVVADDGWYTVTGQTQDTVTVVFHLPEGAGYIIRVSDSSYDITEGGQAKSSGGWIVDSDLEAAIVEGSVTSEEASLLIENESAEACANSGMDTAVVSDGMNLMDMTDEDGVDGASAGSNEASVGEIYTNTWSSDIGVLTLTGKCHNYNPYSIAYNAGYMTLSSAMKGALEEWVAGYDVSLSSGLPDTIAVACSDGNHNRLGWLAGHTGSWTLTATLAIAENGSATLKLVLTGTNGIYYQTFSGSATVSAEENKAYLKIIKVFAFISDAWSPNLNLEASFSVYRDAACTDWVTSISMVASSDTGGSAVALIEVEPGTYYVKETGFADGCIQSGDVMGPVAAGPADAPGIVQDSANQGHVFNWPYMFFGVMARKQDTSGMPLSGAVFEVVYSPEAAGTRDYDPMRTWYFVTDTNGEIRYDDAHYLASWSDGETIYTSDELSRTAAGNVPYLPLGYLYITEVKAPEGYLISDASVKEIQLLPDPSATWEDVNAWHETIQVSEVAAFTDYPEIGYAYLKKFSSNVAITNENEMYSLAGAVYAVTDAEGNQVGTLSTDADGNSNVLELSPGIYTVKETTAPAGYKLDTESHTVMVTTGQTTMLSVSDEPYAFTVDVLLEKKTDYNTSISMEGAWFEIKFYAGASDANGTATRTWILQSDSQGIVRYGDDLNYFVSGDSFYYSDAGAVLPLGYLTIQEIRAPEGLQVSDEVISYTITAEGGAVASDSRATFSNGAVMSDELIWGQIAVDKIDMETADGSAQGNATLAGAVFAVINMNSYSVAVNGDTSKTYAYGEEVMRICTDTSGHAETGQVLQYGSYQLQEVTPPDGYMGDGETTTISFTIDSSGNTQSFTVKNKVIRGGVEVQKTDKETGTKAQGDATLAGAVFEITNQSGRAVIVDGRTYAVGQVIMEITTDETGYAATATDALPYGTYAITEIAAPEGYTLDSENASRIFSITSEGQMYSWEQPVKDRVIRFDISIIKFRDALSGEKELEDAIPLAGIQFEIRLKSTGERILTIETNEEGVATTADREKYPYGRLPYGVYTIHEVEESVPDGLNAVRDFEVNGTIDGKNYTGIYKVDKPIEMPITIIKKDSDTGNIIPRAGTEFQILSEDGELLSFTVHYPHEEEITTFITDSSGTITLPEKLPYGTYYLQEVHAPDGYLIGENLKFTVNTTGSWNDPLEVVYLDEQAKGIVRITKSDAETDSFLSGAVFAVYAAEDIYCQDMTLYCTAGTQVDTFTVGEDGTGVSNALYLGNYYVKEIQAPEGYCLDDARYSFSLTYQDQETAFVYADINIKNYPTTLRLYKCDVDGEALEGVTFVITQITGTESLAAGRTFMTGTDGTLECKYLVPGIYSVEEIATLPGYVIDRTVRYVTVDENGFIFESDARGNALDGDAGKSNTKILEWENDYTKWDFSKLDISGREISGAYMQILDENGKTIASWVSDGTAHRISKLAEGSYTLVEETAPDGYALACAIPFEVTNTGVIQKLAMTDKQVLISKKTLTGEEEVPGATLTVTDSEGKVIDSWISAPEAHAVSGLEVGKSYMLTEIAAPPGYVTSAYIEFTVLDDAQMQTVVMRDDVTKLTVSKKDITTGEELPGAKLQILDADENVVAQWISADTPYYIEKLPIGDYTLVETDAPGGYSIAECVNFSVLDTGEIQQVEMYNTPESETVQTGDNTNFRLAAVEVMLAGTLMFLGLLIRRKRGGLFGNKSIED